MNKFLTISLITLGASSLGSAYAEIRRPMLNKGMAASQVVSLWGQPVEIQEFEAKRQEVWRYGKGDSVTIRESKVISWELRAAQINEITLSGSDQQVQKKDTLAGATAKVVEPNNETRDLVREIAKEIPSGPDVPMSDASGDPAAGNAVIPPPAVGVPIQPAQNGLYANPPAAGFQPYIATDEE
jgi:hypothetical protein